MWAAFRHAGIADDAAAPPANDATAPVIDAALRFVAGTPSPLVIAPIEDLVGIVEQANLPGTTTEHPNWRRRLPANVAELFGDDAVARRLGGHEAPRPGQIGRGPGRERGGQAV